MNCWNEIGVRGDGSCPELKEHIHCRNCPVYATAGRSLLQRTPPDGYLHDWQTHLSRPPQQDEKATESQMVFRIASEYYALSGKFFEEVVEAPLIRTIPHRSCAALPGWTAVRGEFVLVFSLHELLNLPTLPDSAKTSMLAVLRWENHAWAFIADEVMGLAHISTSQIKDPPSASLQSVPPLVSARFTQQNAEVLQLDAELLFTHLKRTYL